MESKQLKRVFIWKGDKIADPNPNFTPIEAIKHLSGIYAEMTTSTLGSQEIVGDEIQITINGKTFTNG
jgi:PRTRC genetic system protein C